MAASEATLKSLHTTDSTKQTLGYLDTFYKTKETLKHPDTFYTQAQILACYLSTFTVVDKEQQDHSKAVLLALLKLDKTMALAHLKYYLYLLKDVDETIVNVQHLNDEDVKRNVYTAYLLLLKLQDGSEKYRFQLKRCKFLIDILELRKNDKHDLKIKEYELAYEQQPKSIAGVPASLWFGETVLDTCVDSFKPLVKLMSVVNDKRLYWVWGGNLLRNVLSLLDDDFYNVQNARFIASAPSPYTGIMSWTLYYARFSLNASLLLKNTFHPELSEAERAKGYLAYWERLKTEWDDRKFTLLNDSIWGVANMACNLWLLDSRGDALTCALLCFDLYVSMWDYEEQHALYTEKRKGYEQAIANLNTQLAVMAGDATKVKELTKAKNKLERELITCNKDWDLKQHMLVVTSIYSLTLLVAFTMLTMPYIPISPMLLPMLVNAGSALCYGLTTLHNGLRGVLDVKHAEFTAESTQTELLIKIDEFKQMAKADEADKILQYLEVRQLWADLDFQTLSAQYQTMHLIRKTALELMIPPVLFASFVFLPFETGLMVLAAAAALAFVIYEVIENAYGATKVEYVGVDNDEYQQFCINPDQKLNAPALGNQGLFKFKPDARYLAEKNDMNQSLKDDLRLPSYSG